MVSSKKCVDTAVAYHSYTTDKYDLGLITYYIEM
jgi:hypothetical protein